MAVPPASPATRPAAPATPLPAARAKVSATAGQAFARLLGRVAPRKGPAASPLAAPPKRPEGPGVGRPGLPGTSHEPAPGHARVDPRTSEGGTGEERDDKLGGRHPSPEELLDPTVRQAALLAPPPQVQAPTPADAVEAPRARMSLEELMPLLVRRIAWAGDKTRGTVRLEIGAGAYAGATLLVHADHGRVRVEVSGVADDTLRTRIDQRLRKSGLDVDSVT